MRLTLRLRAIDGRVEKKFVDAAVALDVWCGAREAAKMLRYQTGDRKGWELDVSNGVVSSRLMLSSFRLPWKMQMLVEKQFFP